MKKRIDRREFLKVAGALPLGFAASTLAPMLDAPAFLQQKPQNFVVIVFDALSALDISMHGFARETTPNLTRLAKRAIKYHHHSAAGNFTSPGTASLLTGVLPWTHRAMNLNGRVSAPFIRQNLFGAFSGYHRIAYSHNGFVNTLLDQFASDIDELIPRESLFLESYDTLISRLFKQDEDIASIGWIRGMKVNEEGFAYSLYLSHLYEMHEAKRLEDLKPRFPRGIPTVSQVNPYLLETAVGAIAKRLSAIVQPILGYFHFMPPHHPYRTSAEFVDVFKSDGMTSVVKPPDGLARKIIAQSSLVTMRREYDEFILYADQEFGRLYDQLESSGVLEDTWLIVTSDHGEMFERGIAGHGSKVLYEPVIHIPLMIFEPGRTEGLDVFDSTSAVDVLPTLAHLAGRESPAWSEGRILPPFDSTPVNRDVYAIQAIASDPNLPLTQASVSLVRENYKLHYYFGYEETSGEEIVKLFDLAVDPEEMNDLAQVKSGVAAELLNALKIELAKANTPYLK